MQHLINLACEWWPWALALACFLAAFWLMSFRNAPLAPTDETDSYWSER